MLANKCRPQSFDQVLGQDVIIKILQKQIANKNYNHSILFTGNAGCGKTTCARIFANQIDGEIYELDCASHNGVADIKDIIEKARTNSLIHEYKVFILEECHTLSSSAWPALLITLEENLPNTIFIFCTTDAQKIPNTIISRVERFNFLPINDSIIEQRLKDICNIENIAFEDSAIAVIAKASHGSLRQSLTNLDTCIDYGDITNENVRKVLNIVSDDIFSDLTTSIHNHDIKQIIDLVNAIYNNGYELHQFVRQYLDYAIEIRDIDLTEILVNLLNEIRYDECPKNIIIARFITYTPESPD
jgi:DNA polymerase-3 subunit gamma/tau